MVTECKLQIIRTEEVPLNSLYYLPHGSFYRDKEMTSKLEPGIYINTKDNRTDAQIYQLLNFKTIEGKDTSERMGNERGKASTTHA